MVFPGSRVPGENMAPARDYDLIIIGSGTAGAAAATAAQPRKIAGRDGRTGHLMGHLRELRMHSKQVPAYRGEKDAGEKGPVDGRKNYCRLRPRGMLSKKRTHEKLRRKKYNNIVETLGVEIIQGEASFLSPSELQAGNGILTAPRFIIATGSSPSFPPLEGIETVKTMTNVEALEPQRSQIARHRRRKGARTGVSQTLRSSRHESNPAAEKFPDRPRKKSGISAMMANYPAAEGINLRTAANLAKVTKAGDRVTVSAQIGGKTVDISAERINFATGRSPNTGNSTLNGPEYGHARAGRCS